MQVTFSLKESIYDCRITVTDSKGSRFYHIPAMHDETLSAATVTAEVFDPAFDLTLTPFMPDTDSAISQLEEVSWTDKFAKKASKLLFDTIENALLRVGCRYRIHGAQDGDALDLVLQTYVFGTFDRHNLLEPFPVMYMFFEVFQGNRLFPAVTAFETNRKEVLRMARGITFAGALGIDFLLTLLFTYPIQIARVKRLTSNKKVVKTLTRFHSLSDAQRQQFLDKQEAFLAR